MESVAYPEKRIKRENIWIRIYKPEYNNIKVNSEKQFFQSNETKEKIGIKSKEKYIKNPKLKEDFIKRITGRIPWNKGKTGVVSNINKQKIAEAMRKRKPIILSQETIELITSKNRIPIFQYDLNNNFIKEWSSGTEAAKFFKAKSSGNFSTAVKKGIKLYSSYWKHELTQT